VDRILGFVASYDRRFREFDGRQGRTSEESALVTELIGSMPTYLGEALTEKLMKYVKTEVKRKVKIVG
jgi:hypothetical protein